MGQLLAVPNQVQTAAFLTTRSLFPHYTFPGFLYTSFQADSVCVTSLFAPWGLYVKISNWENSHLLETEGSLVLHEAQECVLSWMGCSGKDDSV